MLGKKTQSLMAALALLAAAEVGLRLFEARSGGSLPADRPLVFVLGSSRSKAGLAPSAIEDVLALRGHPGAFAANLSVEGATTAGLCQRYLEELAPLAPVPAGAQAVLLIEVRPSGLNDAYVAPEERTWLERQRVERGPSGPVALRAVGPLALLARGGFAAGSRALVGCLALARADELLRGRLRLGRPADGAGDADGLPGLRADWARGERGFIPYSDQPEPGLREGMWRTHYQGTLLKDFHLGGVQTDLLRLLLRRARSDGFRPVLFCMPVTEIQRAFLAPGEHASYLAHVATVAALEGVPFVDLDSALRLPLTAFVDTHHLRFGSVAPVTVELTQRAVLPRLAGL
jgi:hypothetical protein